MLKRKFSALIPAFDPRPGRTNVNQTTDITVPVPGEGEGKVSPAPGLHQTPGLVLVVRGPNLPGVQDIEVSLYQHINLYHDNNSKTPRSNQTHPGVIKMRIERGGADC